MQIGKWPRSRAVYGLDVMLAKLPVSCTDERALAVGCRLQLLEVNSGPDLAPMSKLHGTVVNDVFSTLFAGNESNSLVPDTLLPLF